MTIKNTYTLSFTELYQGIEMIILLFILFFEVIGTVSKIGSSLESNHHMQIKLAKIGETHCITQVQLLVLSYTNWEVLRKLSLPKLVKHIV